MTCGTGAEGLKFKERPQVRQTLRQAVPVRVAAFGRREGYAVSGRRPLAQPRQICHAYGVAPWEARRNTSLRRT